MKHYFALFMIACTFLGTSSMVPTKERNVSGIYLEYEGEGILIDCGEGTQRQMNIAGINRNKVKKVLLSHWHADHMAGLLGLIQTIGNKDKDVHLDVYGPRGSVEYFGHMMKSSVFDQQLDIVVHEAKAKKPELICSTSRYEIWAVELEHGIPTLGFAFIEKDRRRMKVKRLEEMGIPPGPIYAKLQAGKDVEHRGKMIKSTDVTTIVHGKKIAFIADTAFCPQAVELAKEADVMIAEATFAASEEEKAHQYNHMTAGQSAQLASLANAKKLYLTHFSQRYTSLADIREEAQAVFPDTELASDFKVVKLK
jgi:ribonuclease Z